MKQNRAANAVILLSTAIAKTVRFAYTTTTFEKRLSAKICELCGAVDAEHYEIHHVRKVKDLQGKEPWEQIMIAKRRKTLVVCENCHKLIHGKKVL